MQCQNCKRETNVLMNAYCEKCFVEIHPISSGKLQMQRGECLDKQARLAAAKEKVVEAAKRWRASPSYENDDLLIAAVRELEEVSK